MGHTAFVLSFLCTFFFFFFGKSKFSLSEYLSQYQKREIKWKSQNKIFFVQRRPNICPRMNCFVIVKKDEKLETVKCPSVGVWNTRQPLPGGAVVKNPPANAGDTGSCPGPGRSHMPRSN